MAGKQRNSRSGDAIRHCTTLAPSFEFLVHRIDPEAVKGAYPTHGLTLGAHRGMHYSLQTKEISVFLECFRPIRVRSKVAGLTALEY